MGYDSDHPLSKGEVGRCGVAIDSLADMEDLFKDIPLGKITTSMTINAPAAIILAMYIASAQKRRIPLTQLGGTIQNDILKEYIAQKEWIYPPQPSFRLITDTIAFCMKNVPHGTHQHQRLPHPRGWIECRAGTRFYPYRWSDLRGRLCQGGHENRQIRGKTLIFF